MYSVLRNTISKFNVNTLMAHDELCVRKFPCVYFKKKKI